MPSFSASRAACSGAAPPKAIRVRSATSLPLSTACTRAALAMFSSTISATPSAASSARRPSGSPTCLEQRRLRALGVEAEAAAGEARRVDAAEQEVGVGDGRPRCRRGRSRPGRARSRRCPARPAIRRVAIEPGDRAAAGADLHHLDHRDAQRQAAALLKRPARATSKLREVSGLAVVDQADLGGRAAHVEGEHAVEPAFGGDLGGEDGAAGRAGLDQADRERATRLDRGQAAAGEHQEQRAAAARPRAGPAPGAADSPPSAAARRRWRRRW